MPFGYRFDSTCRSLCYPANRVTHVLERPLHSR
jgi:hypothetical protein